MDPTYLVNLPSYGAHLLQPHGKARRYEVS